ncbi:ergothioneine biosynthesis protein EgtB [Kordiimonas laminariae]|uniref:ergothioneine biosynthesis protein EgtB n=1 Tax=Kordiimonas laminariae TaxID=2917717 RepID=UPI001FF3A523|nr:ergothioneine biosynthesis protein EgtB [Kordiimonas laminariae]
MQLPSQLNQISRDTRPLLQHYHDIRIVSESYIAPLSDADATVQSMEDASPAKWHMGHVTWFFETVILREYSKGYQPFEDTFHYLFNSYYEALGARQPRPLRGMLTRPSLEKVMVYRSYVDEHMKRFLETDQSVEIAGLVELGLNHEQQHQELLLTDILHLFAQNPLKPAYKEPEPLAYDKDMELASGWTGFDGGVLKFGASDEGFAFDCERPVHKALVNPFKLANGPVTNRQWLEFVQDGGYHNPLLWLSDGWAKCQAEDWTAPLYWEKRDSEWWVMTLRGMQHVDLDAPVCHISYYEADAFATWADKRLPFEHELELAAHEADIKGNFASSGRLRSAPVKHTGSIAGLYGDVWEWTGTSFSPYPKFKAESGVVGEYNGKFMSGQQVLRGGSCATSEGHMRPTYRNFWHPEKRWQFTGLRLAEDV